MFDTLWGFYDCQIVVRTTKPYSMDPIMHCEKYSAQPPAPKQAIHTIIVCGHAHTRGINYSISIELIIKIKVIKTVFSAPRLHVE